MLNDSNLATYDNLANIVQKSTRIFVIIYIAALIMPLVVSPAVENDIPIIVAIEHAAVTQSPLNPLSIVRRRLKDLELGREQGENEHLKQMEDLVRTGYARRVEDNTYFYKVTDTNIPANSDIYRGIVSFLVWRFVAQGGDVEEKQGGTIPRHEELRTSQGPAASCDATAGQERGVSAFAETAVGKEFDRLAARFRREHFPNEPYLLLEVGMTLPAHWRRGALSLLLGRALEMADEKGIISVMQASDMGWPLYQSLGFEVVREGSLDLKPFGLDVTIPHRDMIRRPTSFRRTDAKI